MSSRHPLHIDRERMLRFQTGDETAFDDLLEAHYRHVINFGYRFLGNKEEAEDLAQEVFLRIYKAKATYRPTAAFTTWLYKIAANLALHWKAKRKPMVALDASSEESHIQIPDSQRTPEQELDRKDIQAAIQKALLSLPENQRIAVLLARFEDMSLEDIGESLNTSVGAVKQLLFRAKAHLRKKLFPHFGSNQRRR